MDKLNPGTICCQIVVLVLLSGQCLSSEKIVAASEIYAIHCQGCHGATGAGLPPAIPDFTDSLKYFLSSPEGKAYLVSVPGASMAPITDAELAGVMNWIIKRFVDETLPANFVYFTEHWVAEHRKPAQQDPASRREQLLEKLRRHWLDRPGVAR